MQTAQERVRATGPRPDRTGSHYPPLGWENPPHLSSGASQIPERILGTDPPGGALRGEEENPGRIHVRAGRRSPPDPCPSRGSRARVDCPRGSDAPGGPGWGLSGAGSRGARPPQRGAGHV